LNLNRRDLANNALHWTAIPLCSIAAGELGRWEDAYSGKGAIYSGDGSHPTTQSQLLVDV